MAGLELHGLRQRLDPDSVKSNIDHYHYARADKGTDVVELQSASVESVAHGDSHNDCSVK